jgi:hypothetical protein
MFKLSGPATIGRSSRPKSGLQSSGSGQRYVKSAARQQLCQATRKPNLRVIAVANRHIPALLSRAHGFTSPVVIITAVGGSSA